MTDTLIALLSMFVGLIGANLFGAFFKKHSLGFIGNTIIGIFGSIFFIKFFGRLGFDPKSIMETGEVNIVLFTINMLVSFGGGIIGLYLIKLLKSKVDTIASEKDRNKKRGSD